MRARILRPVVFALMVSSLLGVAACAAPPGTGEKDAAPGAAPGEPGPGSDIQPGGEGEIKNPDIFVYVGLADPIESLDPAWAYDAGSGEIMINIYDTLVSFDGEATDKFKPVLATEVPGEANGLITHGGTTYAFPIRTGIKFHAGGDLTPEDVVYSFHRGMLEDRAGGPQWLLLEPLLGVSSIRDLATSVEAEQTGKAAADISFEKIGELSPETLVAVCEKVKAAVTLEDGKAVFHLADPFPAFLSVIAGQWGSILDKEWVAAEAKDAAGAVTKAAGWDGSCDTWQNFYDPDVEKSELHAATNGTGPYKLGQWRKDEQILLERNDDYWGERPASLRQVIYTFNSEFSARLLMLQTGDADQIDIPPPNEDQVQPLVEQGLVTLYKDLPEVSMSFWVLNQKVAPEDNEYIASGKLDGEGVPPDFFSDVHVRRAFSYAYDRDTFVDEIVPGYSRASMGPIPTFMLGFNPDQPTYDYSVEKAAEEFREAFDGKLWDIGFKLRIPMVPGAETSRLNREMYKASIAEVNPKFNIEIREVQSSEYTEDFNNDKMPISASGWVQDYHDPHNWAFPLLGSQGYYSRQMDFPAEVAAKLDDLIDEARVETDAAKRKALYADIQQLYYDEALMIPIDEDIGRVYMRSWVRGYTHNPARAGQYYWEMSKQP